MSDTNNISSVDIENMDDIVIPEEGIITTPLGGDAPEVKLDDEGNPIVNTPAEPKPAEEIKINFDPNTDDVVLDGGATPNAEEAVVYEGVANILKEKGFFAGEEELSIKSSADLAEAFDKEVQSRLSDRQRELLEYKNQGVDYSEMTRIQGAIEQTKAITPEQIAADEALAERLVATELRNKGIEPDKYVDLMKKAGTLTEEAVKAASERLTNLEGMYQGEVDKAAKAKADAELAEKKRIDEFNAALESKEILGRKITSGTVDRLKNLVNTPVSYAEDGTPMNAVMEFWQKNPIEYERAVSYLFLATNGFSDLKAFDRSAETRVSKEFRTAVKNISAAPDITTSTNKQVKANIIDMDSIDDIVMD